MSADQSGVSHKSPVVVNLALHAPWGHHCVHCHHWSGSTDGAGQGRQCRGISAGMQIPPHFSFLLLSGFLKRESCKWRSVF